MTKDSKHVPMAGMLRFALTYPKANQLWMCDEQSKDKQSLVSLCTFWLLFLRAFLTGQLCAPLFSFLWFSPGLVELNQLVHGSHRVRMSLD